MLKLIKYGSLVLKLIKNLPTIIVAIDSLIKIVRIIDSLNLNEFSESSEVSNNQAKEVASKAGDLIPLLEDIDKKFN